MARPVAHGIVASIATILAACNAINGASDLRICGDDCDGGGALDDAVVPPQGTPPAPRDAAGDSSSSDTGKDSPSVPDAGLDADADAAPTGCQGALACDRVVFVTSMTFNGDLGGIKGADGKCQAAANASPIARIHGRTFQAWVSTGATSVASRFPHGLLPYRLADSTQVASDWTELTNGGIAHGIDDDELGANHADHAWTGTTSNGANTTAGLTCNEWMAPTPAFGGTFGNVGGNGNGWSGSAADGCDTLYRLYCVEY